MKQPHRQPMKMQYPAWHHWAAAGLTAAAAWSILNNPRTWAKSTARQQHQDAIVLKQEAAMNEANQLAEARAQALEANWIAYQMANQEHILSGTDMHPAKLNPPKFKGMRPMQFGSRGRASVVQTRGQTRPKTEL